MSVEDLSPGHVDYRDVSVSRQDKLKAIHPYFYVSVSYRCYSGLRDFDIDQRSAGPCAAPCVVYAVLESEVECICAVAMVGYIEIAAGGRSRCVREAIVIEVRQIPCAGEK